MNLYLLIAMYVCMYNVNMILGQQMDTLTTVMYVCMYVCMYVKNSFSTMITASAATI